MPSRFQMTFSNAQQLPPQQQQQQESQQQQQQQQHQQQFMGDPVARANRRANRLNSPMVGRIHNARPGCSACGKKVA
jgi:biotin carboxyl carrier protein